MNSFTYFMPTKVFFGKDCIVKNKEVFSDFGLKALILTGKNSAKKNGSLAHITSALSDRKIEYVIFDEVEENPSVETVLKVAEIGKKEKIHFVIGIGGGSPMDCAKAVACLVKNPQRGREILTADEQVSYIPVIEVPTTAGTGSETTPYSIVTDHEKRTKYSISQKIFAQVCFLDASYMNTLSAKVTNNTAIDALSHLIEGYMAKKANFFSDKLAEIGMDIFKKCIPALKKREYSLEIREQLMLASTIAGIVIAQAGTSLPHAMGYYLTYEKNIPHGRANGLLTKAYLELFPEKTKVNCILEHLGLQSLEQLAEFLKEVLDTEETFTEEDIYYYTKQVSKNKVKLSSYPYDLTEQDISFIYKNSVL